MAGKIQFTMLGRFGRFGNQLFQYAFARAYAESIGATLQTPPWIGQVLFEGINDPPCDANLPTLGLDEIPRNDRTDINLFGYFQFAEAFQHYTPWTVRRWFTFKKEWREKFESIRPKLAVHIRRGDYVTTFSSAFATIEEEAYEKAMEQHGFNCLEAFFVRENNPSTFPHPGLEWLQDFFTLMNSQVLFRANSTFSWWAGTLGDARVFSPVVEGLTGRQTDVTFVEGNHPRCTTQPNTSDFILAGKQ